MQCKQEHKLISSTSEEYIMWTKPNFEEMRLGFEVTLYISNR
jgi:coenzyme PQQ precursor peptide PqqA